MIKKTNLVICPNCQEANTINVLGELTSTGDFVIKRNRNSVRIRATNIQIICEQCQTVVFIRTIPDDRKALYADLFLGGML